MNNDKESWQIHCWRSNFVAVGRITLCVTFALDTLAPRVPQNGRRKLCGVHSVYKSIGHNRSSYPLWQNMYINWLVGGYSMVVLESSTKFVCKVQHSQLQLQLQLRLLLWLLSIFSRIIQFVINTIKVSAIKFITSWMLPQSKEVKIQDIRQG